MNRKKVFQGILVSLLINGGLPLLVYKMLTGHLSDVLALSMATLIPLVDTLYHLIKHKRLDIFSIFMLIGFILSILAVFMGGNQKLILLRESFVTGILGCLFLASLLVSRPLIYYFAMRFTVPQDETQQSAFAKNWKYPYFRRVIRIMTAGWGVALVGEAVIKVILVYSLSVTMFLAVSPFVMYGIIGLAVLLTYLYRKYARRRLQEIKNHR